MTVKDFATSTSVASYLSDEVIATVNQQSRHHTSPLRFFLNWLWGVLGVRHEVKRLRVTTSANSSAVSVELPTGLVDWKFLSHKFNGGGRIIVYLVDIEGMTEIENPVLLKDDDKLFVQLLD